MANLIKQKFLEGIDSSKFKIEQGGAIKAVNGSGQLVDVFKFDTTSNVVKVYGDEEVAVKSYTDSLMSQEVQDRNAAINQAISDLINGAPQALDTLKELADKLGDEESAIAALVSQLAQEVTDRQNADAAIISDLTDLDGYAQEIRSDLDALVSGSSVSIQDLQDQITQEVSDRQADVNAEESRAMQVEQGLNSRLTTAESDIDSLESRMFTAEQDINNEESRAMQVEQGLNSRLTTAESDIDSLESRMFTAEQDINNEESRAMQVEQGLNSRLTTAESDIDSLESRMFTAEQDINNEESRAMQVEQGLNSRLTTAESDIDSLESRMFTAEQDINNEESRAMQVEQGLNSRLTTAESDIDSLEGRMSTAEQGLSDEVSARQQGDSSTLSSANTYTDSKIALVMNNLDTEALDSLSEIVTAFEAADSNLNSAITTLSQAASSALQEEITNRQADVDAEEQRAIAAEGVLQSAISQEVSDRQAAVSAEAQARSDEDATMLKLDGSRPMSGDLSMMVDSGVFGNEIKWDRQSGAEQIHTTISYGSLQYNYSNSINGVSQAEGFLLSPNGQQLTSSNGNLFDENNNLTAQNYVQETYYGINGINVTYAQDEVFDQDGNSIAPYINRQTELNHVKLKIENEFGNVEMRPGFLQLTNPGVSSTYMTWSGYAKFHKEYFGNGEQNKTEIDGDSITTKMVTLFDAEANVPFVPTDAAHATNKEYVDSSIVANKPVFDRARIEINTNSKLEKVVLGPDAPDELTILVFVNRLALHLNQDYSISNEGGDYVLTWMGDFATGGVEAVELGDVVYVTYVKQN